MQVSDLVIEVIRQDGCIGLRVKAESDDSNIAIDTMLLAILQLSCLRGIDPKDVIIRTANRMNEIAKTLVLDRQEIDA